jgi:SAM-dependent methyltransferase
MPLRSAVAGFQHRLRGAVLARVPSDSAHEPAPSTTRTALEEFHSDHYLRHDQRRQEHLATLGLDLSDTTVLEVGAGIGDHTSFFVDRGCQVTTSDARAENLELLRERWPGSDVWNLDMDAPQAPAGTFDVVYCYGLLYHLRRPSEALAFLAERCDGLLLLETCVSFGDDLAVNLVQEDVTNPSQAFEGTGCRPTRAWIVDQLRDHFEHVYVTRTQPWHEEFPLDWDPALAPGGAALTRSVFVASRTPLNLPTLTDEVPAVQTRA